MENDHRFDETVILGWTCKSVAARRVEIVTHRIGDMEATMLDAHLDFCPSCALKVESWLMSSDTIPSLEEEREFATAAVTHLTPTSPQILGGVMELLKHFGARLWRAPETLGAAVVRLAEQSSADIAAFLFRLEEETATLGRETAPAPKSNGMPSQPRKTRRASVWTTAGEAVPQRRVVLEEHEFTIEDWCLRGEVVVRDLSCEGWYVAAVCGDQTAAEPRGVVFAPLRRHAGNAYLTARFDELLVPGATIHDPFAPPRWGRVSPRQLDFAILMVSNTEREPP